MAQDSRLLAPGDIITMDIPIKAHAKIVITGYTETIDGVEAVTRDVRREFRTTVDGGVFWTDWQLMTPENLAGNPLKVSEVAIVQLRYTRIGVDNTGVIEWHDITFNGTAEPTSYDTPTIDDSIFADVFPSAETQRLASNLFKKLYFRGIVPKYVIRAEDRDFVEDEDYISYARTVGHFFAMLITYFKRFDNFYDDEELMRAYVRQYGVYFDESNTTLAELQYLTQYLYDEVRKRGTAKVFDRNQGAVDGEFIRLLGSKEYNEFLYEIIPTNKTGWCLGESSPLWRGTSESENLNKTKEDSEDFQDLDNFYTSVGSGGIELVEEDDKQTALITVENEFRPTGLNTTAGGMVMETAEGGAQWLSRNIVMVNNGGYLLSMTIRTPETRLTGNYTLFYLGPDFSVNIRDGNELSAAGMLLGRLDDDAVYHIAIAMNWPEDAKASYNTGVYETFPIFRGYLNGIQVSTTSGKTYNSTSSLPSVSMGQDNTGAGETFWPGIIYNALYGFIDFLTEGDSRLNNLVRTLYHSGMPHALQYSDIPEYMVNSTTSLPAITFTGRSSRFVSGDISYSSADYMSISTQPNHKFGDDYYNMTVGTIGSGNLQLSKRGLKGRWKIRIGYPVYTHPDDERGWESAPISKLEFALALSSSNATDIDNPDLYRITEWKEITCPTAADFISVNPGQQLWRHYILEVTEELLDNLPNYNGPYLNLYMRVPVVAGNEPGVGGIGNTFSLRIIMSGYPTLNTSAYNCPLLKEGFCNGWLSPDIAEDASGWKSIMTDEQMVELYPSLPASRLFTGNLTTPSGSSPVLDVGTPNAAGFGHYEAINTVTPEDAFVVDSALDYEMVFSFKVADDDEGSGRLRFGVEGYDLYGRKLFDSFIQSNNGTSSNQFFNEQTSSFKKGVWYRLRGIIHAYSSALSVGSTTNLGFGNNLVFNNRFVRYILPYIIVETTSGTSKVYIWNYKVRPSVRGQHILPLKNGAEGSHSLGFLECPPLFYMYARNNNNSLSEQDILEFIDKYLLPYNVTTIIQYLSNY